MADYAPCTAVKDKKGTFIHCTSRKREHELVHCNPNVELHEKEILAQGVGTFFKTINRVKKKYNRLKHRTFPAKWEGAFQFTDCVAPAELQEMFMSTIGKLKDTSRTVNAVARVGIVRKALPVSDGSPSLQDLLGSVSDQVLLECIVCLSTHKRRDNRVGTRQLFPCGHTFCEVCINPFRSAEGDDQVRQTGTEIVGFFQYFSYRCLYSLERLLYVVPVHCAIPWFHKCQTLLEIFYATCGSS